MIFFIIFSILDSEFLLLMPCHVTWLTWNKCYWQLCVNLFSGLVQRKIIYILCMLYTHIIVPSGEGLVCINQVVPLLKIYSWWLYTVYTIYKYFLHIHTHSTSSFLLWIVQMLKSSTVYICTYIFFWVDFAKWQTLPMHSCCGIIIVVGIIVQHCHLALSLYNDCGYIIDGSNLLSGKCIGIHPS